MLIKNNQDWAHREAKRRACSMGDAISIYRRGSDDDYIVRAAFAAKPRNGFKHVATIESDGSYSFGSEHA